ncbi:PTS fructose transporter subunit IIC [Enterocloster asparagiformis]|uniref:PTS fructose transporter subunit IIC n=1 Tax=Enterocloster asparagiformis TaxID=333367 RepID=UPI0004AC5EBC|nr:PTS fructose transporter subunit IIC [Enterocloster asparagiformis]
MGETKRTTWRAIQQHLMTGIGYMIPVLMAASLAGAIASLSAAVLGWDIGSAEALESANMFLKFLAWVKQVAAPQCQNLMYPVFGAYLAYSIADRQALAIGFFGGYLALIGPSGFVGAIIIGFASGFFMKWLQQVWKPGRQYRTIMNFCAYPIVGAIFAFTLMFWIVNPLGSFINQTMQNIINAVGLYGELPLAAMISGMMAFDCGGPVNKAAFTIAYSLGATGWNMVPLTYGAMIAPLGFGIGVAIDKFIIKKNIFGEDLSGQGFSGFIMGLFNVTEGALPLVLDDPVAMIPINVIGSAFGAALSVWVGNYNYIGRPGNVLGFFLQDNPLSYMLCLFAGAAVVGVLTCLRRMQLAKKRELTEDGAEG